MNYTSLALLVIALAALVPTAMGMEERHASFRATMEAGGATENAQRMLGKGKVSREDYFKWKLLVVE